MRVEHLLEIVVEGSRPEKSPLHWAKDLDVPDRVETKAPGDAITHDLDDLCSAVLWTAALHEVEIRLRTGSWPFRHFTAIDSVRINNNSAFACLAKNFGQARNRDRTGSDYPQKQAGFGRNSIQYAASIPARTAASVTSSSFTVSRRRSSTGSRE